MPLLKLSRTLATTLLLSSCGGGGSKHITAQDAVGTWIEKLLQSGGITCFDTFLGVCAGCKLFNLSIKNCFGIN